MSFRNNNKVVGLAPTASFQQGKSNVDNNALVEDGALLPWAAEPAGSYVYYECTVGVLLDSGIAVHNRLPQVNNAADTLGAVALDAANLDQITNLGVNLKCSDQYQDIVQRMGHARYWFILWGRALRVGYKIPIPNIKTIGGVPAIPYDRNSQWAYNAIVPMGNFGGIPLWRAEWSLWYTTAVPPTSQGIPVADPSAHISGDAPLPAGIQAPWSQADDEAQTTQPPLQFVTRVP